MQLLPTRTPPAARRGEANGGLPLPPAGEPVRVVRCAHRACGSTTIVRLPRELGAGALRRVVCDRCREPFSCEPRTADAEPVAPATAAPAAAARGAGSLRDRLADAPGALGDAIVAAADGARRRLGGASESVAAGLPRIERGRLWAWASVPLALLGVLVGLLLLQDDSEPVAQPTAPLDGGAPAAEFIEQPGFSLALPDGWEQTNPPEGAVFAAASEGGLADATLWIERAPELSFKRFEDRSLRQLGEIGDNPRVADRVAAPTIEGSIVELRADAPVAGGLSAPYRVTLRGAGPFRHYFATSQQPGAGPRVIADIELLHSSLRPEVELDGIGDE